MPDGATILTLRVESAHGARADLPAPLVLEGRGAAVGRKPGMDWVLPDPDERISRHHFDIEHVDGAYWVSDRSTNGTFVNAPHQRVERPHCLRDGDRLFVGHYVIAVDLAPAEMTVVTPSLRMQPPVSGRGGAMAGTAVSTPARLSTPPVLRAPGFGGAAAAPVRAAPVPQGPVPGQAGLQAPGQGSRAPAAPVPSQSAPQQQAPQPPAPPAVPDAAGFVAAFCEGAGLMPTLPPGTDPRAVAVMAGQALRLMAEHLLDRAQDHPDLVRREGMCNPLLRFPTAQLALEAVLLRPSEGWDSGPATVAEALALLARAQDRAPARAPWSDDGTAFPPGSKGT